MSDLAFYRFGGRLSGRFSLEVLGLALILALSLAALGALSCSLGSYQLSLVDVVAALTRPGDEGVAVTIVWDLRLPRFLMACLAGAMLGMSGGLLQGVTRNPLADPSLVGVSQGAGLAVVGLIVLLPEAPLTFRPVAAFFGGILVAVAILWIAEGKKSSASLRFILIGIGVAAVISAGTNAILTYGQINNAMAALGWLAGSVHTATWEIVRIVGVGLAVLLPVVIGASRSLSALRFEPDLSVGLGLNFRRDRLVVLALGVAFAAIAVSATGPIGFIGLIAPQIVNRLVMARPGAHLLLTGLTGALIVCAADLLGRTAFAPIQLPAGIITAVIGAPLFTLLIFKRAMPSQL